jgi:hypothetical protein
LALADRFESFLKTISDSSPYKEWIVVVWFYIALHYVDAVLAENGYRRIEGHSNRLATLANVTATREVRADFLQLYEESKEARYYGTQYTHADLANVRPLYALIRERMRAALGVS